MAKSVRISLANKCQLMFGAAVLLILTAALSVGWFRMQTLVLEGQQESARRLTNAWLSGKIELGTAIRTIDEPLAPDESDQSLMLTLIRKDEFDQAESKDLFLGQAIERFQTRSDAVEYFAQAQDARGETYYRFVRAIRKSDLPRIRAGAAMNYKAAVDSTAIANPLEMVLLLQLRAEMAHRQLTLNRIYIVAAGLFAGLLAIAAFWFITTRIILSPVRVLRDTASKVSEGDLNIRSDINTGDEFEQLSDVFNSMLENLKKNEDQLRSINKSLDMKIGELSEANVSLYEADKLKGEFLANVSHELRTPLNSIIGFAEVLDEAIKEKQADEGNEDKRRRYISNIIISSRRLLDLINDLLDLAKIEAGRMNVNVSSMSVSDTIEGLVTLVRPQAQKRGIDLRVRTEPGIPMAQTDAGKFHQVLFNLLSNAVKFTPTGGEVTVETTLIDASADGGGLEVGGGDTAKGAGQGAKLRVSVKDTGPGIPREQHAYIFEKFTQLDSSVTKEAGGTGLGLAISKELAKLLQGRIDLESEVGQGATFSLIIPLVLGPKAAPLMPELASGGVGDNVYTA